MAQQGDNGINWGEVVVLGMLALMVFACMSGLMLVSEPDLGENGDWKGGLVTAWKVGGIVAVIAIVAGGGYVAWDLTDGKLDGRREKRKVWDNIDATAEKNRAAAKLYETKAQTAEYDRAIKALRAERERLALERERAKGEEVVEEEPEPITIHDVKARVGCIMIAGGTGAGKTTLAMHFLDIIGGEVLILDPHQSMNEVPWPIGYQVIGDGRQWGQIDTAMHWAIDEVNRRYGAGTSGSRYWDQPLTIVVDEWYMVNKKVPASEEFFEVVGLEGRKADMFLLLLPHSLTVGGLGIEGNGDLRDGFGVIKLYGFQGNDHAGRFYIGNQNVHNDEAGVPLQLPGPYHRRAEARDRAMQTAGIDLTNYVIPIDELEALTQKVARGAAGVSRNRETPKQREMRLKIETILFPLLESGEAFNMTDRDLSSRVFGHPQNAGHIRTTIDKWVADFEAEEILEEKFGELAIVNNGSL